MSDTPATEAVEPKPLILEAVDIQHDTDPADDHGPARRIPHLGHTVLFFSITLFVVFLCINGSVDLFAGILHTSPENAAKDHPLIELIAQIVGYVLTLLLSAWIFPRLWERSFLHGLQWNILALHRRWLWLLLLGIVLSISVQVATPHLVKTTGQAPVERLFANAHSAWITAVMAILFGPLMEEIAFRGFLLPALATAYDWLSIERTPAGLARWQNTSGHTKAALVFASIFASIPFALIHAPQISFAWGIVAVLYGVSLVLSFVRVRTHSVACSTFVHATYNFVIFAVIYASTGGFHHMEQLTK